MFLWLIFNDIKITCWDRNTSGLLDISNTQKTSILQALHLKLSFQKKELLMTDAEKNKKFAGTIDMDISKITTPEEMLELAANEKLKLAQLKTLIEIHPGIVQASIEAMQSLAKVSETAGNSQIESVKTIKESISGTVDVLKILAQTAQSDSTREKIAELLIELAKQHKELCLITERINKNNNKLWKKIVITIGGAAMLVIGGVATAVTLKK
ncbi:hypothetical protein ACIPUG_04725 [Pectobacterium sp. CHL-2024]|uniref:hypothetical protein n=1 Tax=Pectobacterium sp. CHL-2024 TaxID=3377079 RepID=UPI003807E632